LNHESSSLLIRRLMSYTGTPCNDPHRNTQSKIEALEETERGLQKQAELLFPGNSRTLNTKSVTKAPLQKTYSTRESVGSGSSQWRAHSEPNNEKAPVTDEQKERTLTGALDVRAKRRKLGSACGRRKLGCAGSRIRALINKTQGSDPAHEQITPNGRGHWRAH
jgi:hypothetical protein